MHCSGSVQRHQLQWPEIDADNATLTITGGRQLAEQR